MDKPLISFVVLSWNTLDDTRMCIENLKKLTYPNIEIIAVDNGSKDGSKKYLKSLSGIKFVDLPVNTGFTGGQIEALNHCNGDYIALINSDAILEDNWTQACLEVFFQDKKIAAVGGKIFEWNDNSKLFNTDSPFYTYQEIDLKLGYSETKRAGETVIEVDSISGAAVMIRRSAIEKVGYFDNRFFAYYEESDLFARFQRAGYKIAYQPQAHAWHQIAKSTKSKPLFYLYQMHRNRFLFGFKNFDNGLLFMYRYFIDGIRAHIRFLTRRNLDDRARIRAFWWNVAHIINSISARKETQLLGKTYNAALLLHEPGDDITVIIPSYNYAKYLPAAIESIIRQGLKAWKIIVIDDGSTDESVSIAKKYKNVEVISKNNEGIILTKNLGIDKSTTTWTIFLDADDVLSDEYLSCTYNTAVNNRVSVVYTDMEYIGSKSGTFNAGSYSLGWLAKGNFIHNSALISTTLLKNSGGYKLQMSKGYEDWELYVNLLEIGGKFSYCDNAYLKYRQHGDNVQSRNIEANGNAEILSATIRSLHPNLHRFAYRKRHLLRRLIKQTKKHPLLPIVCIAFIPVSILKGLAGYYKYTKHSYKNGIRTYIHKRNESINQSHNYKK